MKVRGETSLSRFFKPHRFLVSPPELYTSNWTGSTASRLIARRWFVECSLDHKGCRGGEDSGWVPPRLLEIDLAPGGLVRLKEDHEILPGSKYTTLSYCWGRRRFFRLEETTESLLRGGVPLEYLPRTFREAIDVTSSLQMSYIWIDSLCIFQGASSSERAHEIQSMDQIYFNSCCNIAAGTAADPFGGLFQSTKAELLCCPAVDVGGDKRSCRYRLRNLEETMRMFKNEVLPTRAWALQELWLAPRVLYFSRDQILWRCYERFSSEQLPRQNIEELPHQED